MRGSALVVGILAAFIVLGPPGPAPAEKLQVPAAELPGSAKKLPVELDTLNIASRKLYAAARKREIAAIPVVIVVSGDDLVLHKKGKRTAATVTPAEYHVLKCVAHTALGLSTFLAQEPDQPLGAERLKTLTEYQALLKAAAPVVEKFGFDADTLARQKRILGRAQEITATILKDGKAPADEVAKFCRVSRADLRANAEAAARAQLAPTHKQVMAWKKEMTAEEWASLTAIVMASGPTARTENAAVQYFGRLFGDTSGEGRRVVYTESTYDVEQALNILGTLRLDMKVGAAVFADNFRLYRDFMADGARIAIDDLLAPP
jgi:hypothetical protein